MVNFVKTSFEKLTKDIFPFSVLIHIIALYEYISAVEESSKNNFPIFYKQALRKELFSSSHIFAQYFRMKSPLCGFG